MRNSSWQTGLLAGVTGLGLLVGSAPGATMAQGSCGNGTGTPCIGDCDGLGSVTVNEILTMVTAALSGGADCVNGDSNHDNMIDVPEIIEAINNALNGCGGSGGGFDPGEECDDGGLCVGGADAGDSCGAESDCEGDGACFGGIDDLRGCRSDDDCRDGMCRKCRPYGGDGCAANCTIETDNAYVLVPGQIDGVGEIVFGTSGAHVKGPFLYVPLPLTGSLILTTGKIVAGQTPIVLKASGIDLDRIPVSTIACACVRGATASTCGGTLSDADGVQSPSCTAGFAGGVECPAEKRCAALHGPGNTGSGFITCGGISVDIDVTQDCNATPGGDPNDPMVIVREPPSSDPLPADKGAAFTVITTAIGTVVGACSGTTADYGPDGDFCTDDDPISNRGMPNSIRFTTGIAQGTVINPADFEDILGPYTTMGAPFTCNGDAINMHGANLAGIFTSCDQPTVSDIVVPVNFVAQ